MMVSLFLKKEQLFRTERAGNPYILGNLFAGCCLDNTVNTSNVTFILLKFRK
jgi:hypothetical protein